MIVSWNWLREYVKLETSAEKLADRLMMAGFNLESVTKVDSDIAIDLEITSNRPDCLGHVGVAREIAVLYGVPLNLPSPSPNATGPATSSVTSVENSCPELCPQYFARVIQGVKVGPSPAWLRDRLRTLGIASINNIVDITNYVLMETCQPLHAFDLDRLRGKRIVVRRGRAGEKITAIDHKEYALSPEMCVIADAERPVAIAGIMGGADTEIGTATRNVLIEVAEFQPLAIRSAARKLGLRSDSSFRFERGVDRTQLEAVARRCAQLILEVAGGTLCEGFVFAGDPSAPSLAHGTKPASAPSSVPVPSSATITLRHEQIRRILGIEIPDDEVLRILRALGLAEVRGGEAGDSGGGRGSVATAAAPSAMRSLWQAPSWRRDLTREIDLIEEVARIHGYEKIPENVSVPLTVSAKPRRDRVIDRLTERLRAAGFDEAVTMTLVSEELLSVFRPRGELPPMKVEHSSWTLESLARQSLVPSLLAVRRGNERHGHFDADLYEVATVFIADDPNQPEQQPTMLGFVGGKSFLEMKGLVESLADAVSHAAKVTARPSENPAFTPGRGAELFLDGEPLGWVGELSDASRRQLDLQESVTVAELDVSRFERVAQLTPVCHAVSTFPVIERDLNFVLDDAVTWETLEHVVARSAGELLEEVRFESQYRGQQIPPGKKSYVLRLRYRSPNRTLTAEEVDQSQTRVVSACQAELAAVQR